MFPPTPPPTSGERWWSVHGRTKHAPEATATALCVNHIVHQLQSALDFRDKALLEMNGFLQSNIAARAAWNFRLTAGEWLEHHTLWTCC